MHEYFITDADGNTFFGEPDQVKRMNFLLNAYQDERESINKDLTYQFPDSDNIRDSQNHIKLIPTYSGFKVLVRVNQHIAPDSSILYEPFFALPADLSIPVLLLRNNSSIEQYTNSRLSRPYASVYFFSNDNTPDLKAFPFLSNPVPPRNWGYSYEQGELALVGTEVLEFYKDITAADSWRTVSGIQFVNETDRMLISPKIKYIFGRNTNVTNVVFVLKDMNGNEVKTIAKNGTVFLDSVSLDFTDVINPLPIGTSNALRDYIYNLQVSGDNGYQYSGTLIFNTELFKLNPWAVFCIRNQVPNNDYHFIGTDGMLVLRKDKNGFWTQAPIFEIPIKSRLSFWRYKNSQGNELDLTTDLTDYLFKTGTDLQTRTPRSLARSYFLISNDAATTKKYLPNPIEYNLVKDDSERACFDIKVPESDLFPILP
jgi:hypothetical protein